MGSVDGVQGQVTLNPDGTIVFTIDSAFTGAAGFSYVVSDGTETDTATVAVRIDSPFVGWSQGGIGNDKLFGNHGETSQIYGGAGNDHVKGGQEADWLAGGDGADKLQGLSGDDHLWGNAGNDELTGNGGFDTAYFYGLRASYSVQTVSGTVRVVDNAPAVDGDDGTDTIAGIELLSFKNGETASVISPILLDLDGDGVETLSAAQSHARFDLDGDGLADDTSWVGKDDGLLYVDRNGDGTVSGANEITFIDDWPGATSDLSGLRGFDSDGDGKLSSGDERFGAFGVWRDANGKAEAGETRTLAAAGIASLDLAGTAVDGTYAFGDAAILNTGSYTRADGTTHALADAALTYFSARLTASGQPAAPAVFPRVNKRQEVLEWLAGGRITDGLYPSDTPPGPPMPFEMPFDPPAQGGAGQADSELGTKLALMRQDLGSFGSGQAEGLDRRIMADPKMLHWYA